MFSEDIKKLSLKIVREAVKYRLIPTVQILECPCDPVFMESFGLFVTIHKYGNLRGCIGYIKPYKPLYYALIDLAQAAAFNDNRFNPVKIEELNDLEFEISVLSPLSEIRSVEEIEIGRDGLYIEHPWGSGLLLPQVASKYNWSKEQFLKETCYKASLSESYLNDTNTKIYKFEAVIFNDDLFSKR